MDRHIKVSPTGESVEEAVAHGVILDSDDDPVNHPDHYQSFNQNLSIECIDAMRAAFGDGDVAIWCKLNAFKYLWRADSKGKNTDVKKAIWYEKKYLELNT